MQVFDVLRRSQARVFVSLFSCSTGGCMHGSKRIGIETVVKNNGERFNEEITV